MRLSHIIIQFTLFLSITASSFATERDDGCFMEDGQNGTCVPVFLCDEFHQANTSWKRNSCSIKDYVCCPRSYNQGWTLGGSGSTTKDLDGPGVIAKKWCKYYLSECPCRDEGLLEVTAEAGRKATHKQDFPHMAAIGYGPQNDIIWQCGGSLISEDYVLTAAHCLFDGQYLADWVRLGTVIVQDKSRERINCSDYGQTHPVIERIIHPKYRKPSKYHDIALLKIGPAIEDDALSTLSRKIHPACLHSSKDLISEELIATGWGSLGSLEDLAPVLHDVNLLVYNNSECNKTYDLEIKTTRQLQNGIDDSQICAGQIEEGADTCQGDSGGPLHVKDYNSCFKIVAGITSFGKECGSKGSLAVYTRISHYLGWIEENAWKGRKLCHVDDDHYGECLSPSNCTQLQQENIKDYRPKICGYDQEEPKICCPSINQKQMVPL